MKKIIIILLSIISLSVNAQNVGYDFVYNGKTYYCVSTPHSKRNFNIGGTDYEYRVSTEKGKKIGNTYYIVSYNEVNGKRRNIKFKDITDVVLKEINDSLDIVIKYNEAILKAKLKREYEKRRREDSLSVIYETLSKEVVDTFEYFINKKVEEKGLKEPKRSDYKKDKKYQNDLLHYFYAMYSIYHEAYYYISHKYDIDIDYTYVTPWIEEFSLREYYPEYRKEMAEYHRREVGYLRYVLKKALGL